MRKKFLSDFFFIQIINLLIKPIWILVIDRKVQNLLPTEEYGTYFSLSGYSLLFMIVLDLGLTNFNNREVAIDRNFYRTNFWSIIGAKTGLTVLFFIIAAVVGLIIGFTSKDFYIFGLLALNQSLLSFNTYLRSNISAVHQFKVDGILSVIDRLFVVLSLSFIIWTNYSSINLSLYTFILAQTAGLLLTFILAFVATYNYLGKAELNINISKIVALLKKAMPFASIIALMTIFTRLDSVLILKLLPNGRLEAGNYAMSYRLLDAASIVGVLLAGQLLPMFSSNIVNKARLQSIVKWTSIFILIPAVLITFIASFYGSAIMEYLYPLKSGAEQGPVFSLLIWCIPGMVLVNIFGTLLTAAGRVNQINRLALVTCFINLVGNLVFISIFGLIGAAITAVITQLFFGIVCFMVGRKIY